MRCSDRDRCGAGAQQVHGTILSEVDMAAARSIDFRGDGTDELEAEAGPGAVAAGWDLATAIGAAVGKLHSAGTEQASGVGEPMLWVSLRRLLARIQSQSRPAAAAAASLPAWPAPTTMTS